MVKSIFTLERRFDFDKEFKRLLDLLEKRDYINVDCYDKSFWDLVNQEFKNWKYRISAVNVEQYLEDIGIDFDSIYNLNDKEKFYVLQLVINWVNYIISNDLIYDGFTEDDRKKYLKPVIVIYENIKYILESLNYKLVKKEDLFSFTKRDENIDSILKQLENEDDLRIALLSYNDFRIENDLNEKKSILFDIATWLEPHKSDFLKINNSLTNDVFFILNKADIRHNNRNELQFKDDSEKLKLYDDLFKMIVHLIRESDIKIIQSRVSELKKK